MLTFKTPDVEMYLTYLLKISQKKLNSLTLRLLIFSTSLLLTSVGSLVTANIRNMYVHISAVDSIEFT